MKEWKKVLGIYLLLIILKIIFISLLRGPSVFSDGFIYSKIAQSIYETGKISIYNIPSNSHPPLYSLLLSLSYIANNMEITYYIMKLINVFVSTTLIIPVWLLAKEFLNKKNSLLITLLIGIMPFNFIFSGFIMSENLFFPLTLFTVYFFYKSLIQNNWKYGIISGIFGGLAFLTKTSALALLGTFVITILILVWRKQNCLKSGISSITTFCSIISIWFIRNGLIYGFTLSGIMGNYAREITEIQAHNIIPNFLTWILLYFTALMLSSGIILFIEGLRLVQKENKSVKLLTFTTITLSLATFFVIIAANHNLHILYTSTFIPWLTGRIILRYVEVVLPLIMILGFIGYNTHTKLNKINKIIISILVVLSSQLLYFRLFPSNNSSLSILGTMQEILNPWLIYLIIIITTVFLLILKNKLQKKTIIYLLFSLFIISSILGATATIYNVETYWYNSEQTQFGLWINKNIPSDKIIMFDKLSEGKIVKENQSTIYEILKEKYIISIMGFWFKNKVIIGDINENENFDYYITQNNTNKLKLIKISSEKNYYLYHNHKD
jgi:4-amino-4-deoxy-L-arabinose transferase-like glycosyltransferase